MEGEPGEFACPAFSPDGARIAVPLENGPIKVWDLAFGREEHSLKADEGASYQNVVFSPDGKRLAAAGFHDLAAWDLEGEKPLLRLDLGKDALVDPQTLFFTPDGGAVEYVTLNPGVVFNVRRFGKDEPERKVECSNLSDTIAALSPDARRLALKDKDGEITLWDLTPGREVAAARWTGSTHGEYFGCLAFSGDGGRLINVNDEDVTVWDTGKPYPQRRLAGQAPPISSITLSRDGGRLAAGGDFGVVVWDAADGRTWSIDASAQKPFQFTPHPAGRPSAFSPDGKRLVCPAAGALRVWDLDARKEERTLDVGGKDVTTVAWAADGRITALTEDGVVRVWGEGAEPERTWTCPDGQLSESRLSADGAVLWSGYGPWTVWDVPEGRLLRKLEEPGLSFGGAKVSADGRRLAQSSVDPETRAVRITVWDRDRPDAILTVDVGDADLAPKDKSRVANAFALSPDGRRLAIALKDGTVQLWDVDSGREALVTRQHGSELVSLSFSEDGRRLAGIAVSGDVTLFTAAPDAP